jgi:phage-related protein (TIGR01555 family)
MAKRKKLGAQHVQDSGALAGKRPEALTNAVNAMMVRDAFQNLMARTGAGMPNLMEGSNYINDRLTRNYQLLNTLYRSNWLARRVIDIIPKDMLRNGWKYETDLTPEQIDKLYRVERKTRILPALLRGLNFGRLYGGAAALMMIEGQEDQLDEPLELESILPGDFKGLMIVDRWSGIYPDLTLVQDWNDPEFGLPEFYEFRASAMTSSTVARVHHSRILRFTGWDLPEIERQVESYWGLSVLEPLLEELKKRDNTSANIAQIIFQANLKIFKMKDLDQLLTNTDPQSQKDLYNVVSAQNALMNSQGMLLMGNEDDFQQFSISNFRGLQDIYDSFKQDVAGAAQIPMRRLFGYAPAGMSDTGEADDRNYYDVIVNEQEATLRPVLEKLGTVLCMSALGFIPDDLEFTFNPVSTPSDKDVADIIKAKGESIIAAHSAGIISDRIAAQEFKQAGEGTNMFSNITDEYIAKLSDDPTPPMGPLGLDEEDDQEPGKDKASDEE